MAHGGTAGLIAESFVAICVAALLGAVWLRERRVARLRAPDEREP